MEIERYKNNPIIAPNKRFTAIFNPGVIVYKNKILLYARVVNDYCKYISRIDLYESTNGINFRLVKEGIIKPDTEYDSWGCEDPRATMINNKIYITYVAQDKYAWENKNQKVMLVEVENPYNDKEYKKVGVITRFSDHTRNVVMFNEKINGYYAMLFRPYNWGEKPSIWFAVSKDLKNWEGFKLVAKPEYDWEELKIGPGVPPLKTEFGWVLIYHGVDNRRVYRVGLMILDKKEPWKVIFRYDNPIWEPKKWYEKYGDVPNVVFPTGGFIKENKIWIYAGTVDKYISLGFLNIEDIKEKLSQKL